MDNKLVVLDPFLALVVLLAHFGLWWLAARIVVGRWASLPTLLSVFLMAWGLPIVFAGGVATSRCCSEVAFLVSWEAVAVVVDAIWVMGHLRRVRSGE